jgi:hypothetical protein
MSSPPSQSGAEDETQDFSYPLSYTPQPCKLLDSVPLRGKGTAQEWSNLLFSREETAEEVGHRSTTFLLFHIK